MNKIIILLLIHSSFCFGQESIDDMFNDGLTSNYKLNPSIDVARLIAGTPNLNLEVFLHEDLSISGGIGLTTNTRLRLLSEILDGNSIYESGIKFGTFWHLQVKYFYAQINEFNGYFAVTHNLHHVNLNDFDIAYQTKFYKLKQYNFGGGAQWHGAHNITYDYYLGVGFEIKNTYAEKIGGNLVHTDNYISAGFILAFKVGFPIL